MLVRDLIDRLEKYHPDSMIILMDDEGGWSNLGNIIPRYNDPNKEPHPDSVPGTTIALTFDDYYSPEPKPAQLKTMGYPI